MDDKFLERHKLLERNKLPKLIKEQIENRNRLVISEEIECAIKNLSKKKIPISYSVNSNQIFKEEIMLILHTLFQ